VTARTATSVHDRLASLERQVASQREAMEQQLARQREEIARQRERLTQQEAELARRRARPAGSEHGGPPRAGPRGRTSRRALLQLGGAAAAAVASGVLAADHGTPHAASDVPESSTPLYIDQVNTGATTTSLQASSAALPVAVDAVGWCSFHWAWAGAVPLWSAHVPPVCHAADSTPPHAFSDARRPSSCRLRAGPLGPVAVRPSVIVGIQDRGI
jgi:hypothetical protein